MKKNVKKITVGGLLIALALVLPMAFHLTGVPQPGQVFLPMHIPVLLGGFVLGPVFGFFVGLFSPIISSVLTGMPAVGRLPFMMIELAVYGLVSGLMYNTFKFNKKKMGTYISLLTAMLCGRIVYAISLFVAVNLMGIQCGGPIAAVTATVSGVPGIIIQVLMHLKGAVTLTDILESAKEQLHNNNFSIVIVGENDVYTSTKHGVAPLLEILDGGNDVIKNSFVADKVVGKAAALLMVKGGVKEVYADIISSHALDVFEKYKIKTYYGNLVEYIINRDKTGMCPMEKAVLEVDEPNTAYDVLKKKIAEMRKGGH